MVSAWSLDVPHIFDMHVFSCVAYAKVPDKR